jgi:hypothetical protein
MMRLITPITVNNNKCILSSSSLCVRYPHRYYIYIYIYIYIYNLYLYLYLYL